MRHDTKSKASVLPSGHSRYLTKLKECREAWELFLRVCRHHGIDPAKVAKRPE